MGEKTLHVVFLTLHKEKMHTKDENGQECLQKRRLHAKGRRIRGNREGHQSFHQHYFQSPVFLINLFLSVLPKLFQSSFQLISSGFSSVPLSPPHPQTQHTNKNSPAPRRKEDVAPCYIHSSI